MPNNVLSKKLIHRGFVATVATLALAAATPTVGRAQGGARVTVTASALDASGRPVADLTAADLRVQVETGTGTVARVARLGAPRDIVVLLDMSASSLRSPQKMHWNKQCVVSLAGHLAGARNFLVLGYSDRVIELYNGVADPKAVEASLETVTRQGHAAPFEVLKYLGESIAQQGGGDRTVVVAISDGVDNASRADSRDVTRALGIAGIPLYSIIVMDPAWNPESINKLNAKTKLQDIAKATGGASQVLTPGETAAATSKIASLLAGRYLIEIDPAVPLAGKAEAKLLLGANREGVEVYSPDRVYPK